MKFLLILLMLFPSTLCAADVDYSAFKRTPVLHEGRIKPLDSFARISLKKIYGDKALPDKPAISWLAGVMFAPVEAVQEKVFYVRVPEVMRIMALPERSDALFSFAEMAEAFGGRERLVKALTAKDKKNLTENEQEILRLYVNISDFAEIMGSFSLLLPFPNDPDITYLDALKSKRKIDSELRKTVKKKGDKIDIYLPEEQRNARLSYRMSVLEALDSHNTLLRVIPPSWQGSEEWLAPWAVIERGAGSPKSIASFHDWQALANAYNAHDTSGWRQVSGKLSDSKTASVRPFALSLEVLYNTVDPLHKSIILYVIGVLVAGVALLWPSLSYQKPVFSNTESIGKKTELSGIQRLACNWMPAFAGMTMNKLAYVIILMASALHGLALLARMTILMRPPVSTLYESMIFVSFISACFGLWLEHKKKGGESLLISGVIASLLIAAANVFAADSDTLEVLVAVLNTNFWLGTHVVCITVGYASSLVAGAIAHTYLIKRAIGKATVAELAALQRRLHHVALAALLFTAVGTMLGGIWADQSWGRFWGWDPKENGALWIVLWLIWALHGRIAGQLRETGFACILAFITIVVALAWVGVNLLSVGLHSYGFTDVAANGLMVFCAVEILFISGVTGLAVKRHKASLQ